MATTHLLTAEDLLEMPDDGHRYELVRGELREMPPSGHIHARIAGRVSSRLGHYAEANRLFTTQKRTDWVKSTLPTPASSSA